MGFYDQFKRPGIEGEFETVKFEMAASPQQPFVVEGVVEDMTSTDFGGSRADKVPEYYLKAPDGVVRQVACGQVNLLRKVLDACPEIGDHLRIEYQGEDKARQKSGKNAPKMFEVIVTPKTLQGARAGSTAPGQAARQEAESRTVPDDFMDEPF